MKYKEIIVLAFLFAGVGCHHAAPPAYKLSDERLAHLMLDIQLTEVALADLNKHQQDSIKDIFDQQLSRIYKITPAEIKQQMDLLQSDPVKLKWVINRAKEMADSIQ